MVHARSQRAVVLVPVLVTLGFLCSFAHAKVALGPFSTEDDLLAAREQLTINDVEFEPRESVERESLGFIVVSEEVGGDVAETRVRRLEQLGLADLVYVAVGVYQGRVSAGVFSTRESAESRVEDLSRLGFDFDVLERSRVVSYEGWLDVEGFAVPAHVVSRIEDAVGYSPSTVVSGSPEPELEETAAAAAKDEAPEAVSVEPKPAAVANTERAPAPTSAPDRESAAESAPARATTPAVPTEPASTSRIPFVAVLVLAILASAAAAFLYVRMSRRSPLQETNLLGYERGEEAMQATSKDPVSQLADLLLSDTSDEPGTALLASMSSTDSEVIELMGDLLRLASRSQRTLTFDLNTFFEDFVIKVKALSIVDAVRYETPERLPFVDADAERLDRTLTNLFRQMNQIDNAVPVNLRCEIGGDVLVVTITTTFTELDSHELDSLFDTGSIHGIRLATTRRLARAIGGDVSIASEADAGTSIRLDYPVEIVGDNIALSDGRIAADIVDAEADAQARVKALTAELAEAKQMAEAEMAVRTSSVAEATDRVESLKRELEEAKARVEEEAHRREEALASGETQIEALKEQLASETAQLNEQLAERDAAEKAAREQVDELTRELEQQTKRAQDAANEIAVKEQHLEAEIERLNGAIAQHNEARDSDQEKGNARIAMLTEELDIARAELSELREQAQDHDPEALAELRSNLGDAEEKLTKETTLRERVEKETTAYIDELLNDLNKARADTRKEEKERSEAEIDAAEKLDKLSAELDDTRRRLIAESAARQRAEERAKAAANAEADESESVTPGDAAPIRSVMPMNNPILHSMAERFVGRLGDQLDALDDAFDDENAHEMLLITGWLKGEAYTLGFHEFTQPVTDLETCLKEKEYTRIPAKIVELKHMASRVELEGPPREPAAEESGAPLERSRLTYQLPDNPRKAELMENFIDQLGTELLEMESAQIRGKTRELERSIEWVLKYAGAFNLEEIVGAVEALEESVSAGRDDVGDKLGHITALYSTIEINKGVTTPR